MIISPASSGLQPHSRLGHAFHFSIDFYLDVIGAHLVQKVVLLVEHGGLAGAGVCVGNAKLTFDRDAGKAIIVLLQKVNCRRTGPFENFVDNSIVIELFPQDACPANLLATLATLERCTNSR